MGFWTIVFATFLGSTLATVLVTAVTVLVMKLAMKPLTRHLQDAVDDVQEERDPLKQIERALAEARRP